MILELAIIYIKEGSNKQFEESLSLAQSVVKKDPGYISHEFKKCVEEDNKYILLIKWTSIEAHNEGFRKSDLFVEWRALIGPFFQEPPLVQHYDNFLK